MSVPIPAPNPTPESAPFWESLSEHTLRLPLCGSCQRFQFPPMPGCGACGAAENAIEWRQVAGGGRVHSWFVAHHAFHPAFEQDLPYVVADIVLDEGVRINGRLVGIDHSAIRADLRVRVAFDDCADFTRLAFEPDEQERA